VSPFTGELIEADKMEEHMRVSLIDPRYQLQREAMLNKSRDNTRASDNEIEYNLGKLARSRPDVFGEFSHLELSLVSLW
jgi:splicing factor 3A subunit 1